MPSELQPLVKVLSLQRTATGYSGAAGSIALVAAKTGIGTGRAAEATERLLDTASMYGLGDRGLLQPGMVGDVNVIDYEHVQLERPVMVHDLPGDARRFVQRARGYLTTVKSGEVILCDGDDQGARPGRLLRGAR